MNLLFIIIVGRRVINEHIRAVAIIEVVSSGAEYVCCRCYSHFFLRHNLIVNSWIGIQSCG